MKFIVAFAALLAVCAALPIGGPDADAITSRDIRTNDGISGYDFDFETSNGIARKETGVLKAVGEEGAIVVNGVASWTSPEGIAVVLKYIADENGYQPVLPVTA